VNYGSTKDYIIFWKDEQTRFARNVTEEEHSKTTPCQPCDSECKATFPMNTFILAVNIVLLLVFSLLINANGHFFADLMIVTLLVLLAYVFLVDYLVPSVDVYCETIVNSLVSDCNILDKANDLTVHVYNDTVVTINITKNTRSRYSKYVYCNYRHVRPTTHNRAFKRGRAPSRIPVRTLKSLKNKSRKLRQFVYKAIRSNIPKSSKIHSFMKCPKRKKYGHCHTKFKRKITKGNLFRSRRLSFNCRASQYISLFSCNKPMSSYKSQSHLIKHCQSKLYTDIEKNPGPNVDPSKTIIAPYSQGNVAIFGQNAGQQCVAMSLCSLIYNAHHGINSSNDLVNIMDIGNQLYSRLSQSAKQAFLLQTELPTMLNVFDTDYKLQYSESYTGTLHQQTTIEGYDYCTSLQMALQSLMSDNNSSCILTIASTAVAIYGHGNMGFKVFDSHARDLYGRSNINGTCILLEFSSLDTLIHYFQSIHNYNDLFEVKGVTIDKVQSNVGSSGNNSLECTNFKLSCTVAIYSICYSLMKSCGYWTPSTLSNVIDGGKQLYKDLSSRSCTEPTLPNTVNVCGAEITINYSNITMGELSDSLESKSILKKVITSNLNAKNTGFLLWFSSYCISSIFKPTTRSNYLYSFLIYDESRMPPLEHIKNIKGTCMLVDTIFNAKRNQSIEHYKIQFLSCACENIDKNERKRLLNNQRQKQNFEGMEPPKKKLLLERSQARYNANKKDILSKRATKYKTMDRNKKKMLLDKKNKKYRAMDDDKKQELLDKQNESYRTMDCVRQQRT